MYAELYSYSWRFGKRETPEREPVQRQAVKSKEA